jgi:hypothetical protein
VWWADRRVTALCEALVEEFRSDPKGLSQEDRQVLGRATGGRLR